MPELAKLIAHLLRDPNLLREVVAGASHDIVMGQWRLGGYADPRRMVEDMRIDVLADAIGTFDQARLVDIAGFVLDAVVTGRLDPRSMTMAAIREAVGYQTRMRPSEQEDWRRGNAEMAVTLLQGLHATGTTSDEMTAAITAVNAKADEDRPMLSS